MRTRIQAIAFLSGLMLSASLAAAEVQSSLSDLGWNEITFSNKMPNRFVALDDGGIEVSSDHGVSLLKKPVMVDLTKEPTLSWRWRVATSAPATDLSIRGDDDRSLAVYVAFPFVPEEAGFFERLERRVVERTMGKDTPWRVLAYVWGGLGERGDQVASPHMGDAAVMTILRPPAAQPSLCRDQRGHRRHGQHGRGRGDRSRVS
ncbi:MAG: DUF3047 domain-containing protein [Geminicoccaceae bacterium]